MTNKVEMVRLIVYVIYHNNNTLIVLHHCVEIIQKNTNRTPLIILE